MIKSQVYFIDFRTTPKQNILNKLRNLLTKAGLSNIEMAKKFVAVKMHFGEPGNMSYLRPNYVAVVVKAIQENGGLAFLTDANTLYKGRRSNGIDHLQSALENGFNPLSVGCNVVIADGIRGTEYREIEINLKHCKTAKIGSAVADSDVVVVLSHFKGHEMTGFGGALKNIGMGCGSVGGKLEMHSNAKPAINVSKCVACKVCERNCNHDAVHIIDKKAVIDYDKCVGCGQCVAVCVYDAAHAQNDSEGLQEKIAEYSYAVLKDKPSFFVNFLMDISPECDCWHFNDTAIVPNIGILASTDPVAIDRASADLVNKAQVNHDCMLDNHSHPLGDKFIALHPTTDWRLCLDYAETLGLGTQNYELIKLE